MEVTELYLDWKCSPYTDIAVRWCDCGQEGVEVNDTVVSGVMCRENYIDVGLIHQ